jgi:hypothetical protein
VEPAAAAEFAKQHQIKVSSSSSGSMLDDVSDPGISAFEEEREKKTWLV